MVYSANRGYGSGVSYSFSSRPSDYMSNSSRQMEYTNNFVVSYSGTGSGNTLNDFNYVSRGSNGIDYNTKGGNSFFGTMGGGGGKGTSSGGSGRGTGRGRGGGGGKGLGRSKGQRKGIGNKGQRCIDMQNQFIVEGRNNDPLTEIDLAIKNLNLSDLPQNQIITQEFTQLEMVYHKETTLVKKAISKQEHLELIIRKVESLSKKYSTAILVEEEEWTV